MGQLGHYPTNPSLPLLNPYIAIFLLTTSQGWLSLPFTLVPPTVGLLAFHPTSHVGHQPPLLLQAGERGGLKDLGEEWAEAAATMSLV